MRRFHPAPVLRRAAVVAGSLLLITPFAIAQPAAPVVTPNAVPVATDVPPVTPFNPEAPAQPAKGQVVNVTLEAKRAKLEVKPGETQEVWTFNGQVPAPTIRVHQGDTVRVTLVNKDPELDHGLDFHAGQMDSGTFHKPIKPGSSETFEFQANHPGVFYYHCSAGPVLMHIANGMFGAVIVDPPGYTPAGKEFVLIQSEWYSKPTDLSDLMSGQPEAMAFNGVPSQYTSKPLTADPGKPVRFYFVDAGPNHFSAFHVIGTIFDKVLLDGNPENSLSGVQTVAVPPGGTVVADLVADTGTYPILTHVMKDATEGALGILQVGNPGTAEGAGGHDMGSMPAQGGDTGSAPAPAPAPAPAADGNTVSISNFAFAPSKLTVKAGTTVTFINNDDAEHTVTDSDAATPADRLFDSSGQKDGKAMQTMKKGDKFSFTFDKPGTYHFKCLVHPFMTGTIVVQ